MHKYYIKFDYLRLPKTTFTILSTMVSVEEFLWILLKNTELNQPNYHAIARELGSGNANTV